MLNPCNYLAIIPARAGSKGIPKKNLQLIGNKPMIQFSFEAVINASRVDDTLITTDDREVIELAESNGLEVPFIRPSELSTDTATTAEVVLHALHWFQEAHGSYPKNFVLLQPTSPFRTSNDIDAAIAQHEQSPKRHLISACEPMQHPSDCLIRDDAGVYRRLEIETLKNQRTGRQAYSESLFIDGAIYICNSENFIENQDFIGVDPDVMLIPQSHAIDIDTPYDLKLARSMIASDEFQVG